MKFNDISIKIKLLSVFVLFIATFLVSWVVYDVSSGKLMKNNEWVLSEADVVRQVNLSKEYIDNVVIAVNNCVICGEQEKLVNFDRHSREAIKELDNLETKISMHTDEVWHESEAYQENLDNSKKILDDIILLGAEIINEYDSKKAEDIVIMNKRIDSLSLEIRDEMSKLAHIATTEMDQAAAEIPLLKNQIDLILFVARAIGVILIIIAWIVVKYSVLRRLQRLMVGVKEFGSGNLDYVIGDGKDEIGTLAQALDIMASNIKESQAILAKHKALDVARHDLVKKLGSSLDMEFIMRSISEAVHNVFPDIVVSYVVAPMGSRIPPNMISVYATGKIGEGYLREVKETVLLGLETLPSLRTVAPVFDKWRSSEFDVSVLQGERSIQLDNTPRSSVNIPLVIPQSIAGIFNFSSSRDGIFGEQEINTLYSIVSSALETTERLKILINNEQRRMTNMIDSIGDGVLVIDRSWNVILINKAATTISGFTSEETTGRHFSEVFNVFRERDREKDFGFIEKAMADKVTQSITEPMILVSKGGREIPIGDSAAPFIDHTGEVVGAIIVFRDITKERESQAIKSDFAYASHQLRTPVSKAMWNLEIALGSDDMEQLKSATHIAYDSMKSVQKLSEELIDVSRIDKGEVIVEKEHVIISNVITSAVDKIKKLAEASQIELVVKDVVEVDINANKKLLTEALFSVLNNATIYNHAGGRVEIMARRQEDSVLMEVSDNGIGISAEHSPLVFTKFFRGSNFDTTAIAGAGLGLYIAKAYVTLLGGKIWFKSEEGKGTTFFISVPIA